MTVSRLPFLQQVVFYGTIAFTVAAMASFIVGSLYMKWLFLHTVCGR